MKLVVQDAKLQVEATRTELIAMAVELLIRAQTPEFDFDPRYSCSSCCFDIDEDSDQFQPTVVHDGLQGITFVRTKEKPPRRTALEAPHAALDTGE